MTPDRSDRTLTGSAKRSGTKSLLRCVQTLWSTTRNVWSLWFATGVLPPSTNSCFMRVKYLFHSLKSKFIYNFILNAFFKIFFCCCYSVSHCSNKPTIISLSGKRTNSAGDQIFFFSTYIVYVVYYFAKCFSRLHFSSEIMSCGLASSKLNVTWHFVLMFFHSWNTDWADYMRHEMFVHVYIALKLVVNRSRQFVLCAAIWTETFIQRFVTSHQRPSN